MKLGLVRGGVLAGDVVDDRGYPVAGATHRGRRRRRRGHAHRRDLRDDRLPRRALRGVARGPGAAHPHGRARRHARAHPRCAARPPPPPSAPAAPAPSTRRPLGDARRRHLPLRSRAARPRARHRPPPRATSRPSPEALVIRSGAESTTHVVLRQGGWIEGRVIEEDRTPVRGARIELAATRGALEKVAYAADDGTFTFAAAPEEVLLSVSRPESPGDVVSRASVDVPDRDRATRRDRPAQAARDGEPPRRPTTAATRSTASRCAASRSTLADAAAAHALHRRRRRLRAARRRGPRPPLHARAARQGAAGRRWSSARRRSSRSR